MKENTGGRVSVILPARNEEENIARAVRSLAAQEEIREIIVADDQSRDRTGEILAGLQEEIAGLRTLRIESLPEGWAGKTHALATAAKAAGGEWLLFTDADVEHLPGSLATLLRRAEAEQADLLSVSPGQQTPTWWEKAVIPFVYVRLARLYRFEDVNDPNSPVAAANGQFMLIRRDAYERAGGFDAVRAEMLEDVALARRVKAADGRLVFCPGSAWVRTRMYQAFPGMWQGWTKNLYLLYGQNLKRLLTGLGQVALLDLVPFLAFLILCCLLVLGRAGAGAGWAAVGCLLLSVSRQWSYRQTLRRLGYEAHLACYQIPGAILFSLLLLNSALAYRLRGRVEWKGRVYSTKGGK